MLNPSIGDLHIWCFSCCWPWRPWVSWGLMGSHGLRRCSSHARGGLLRKRHWWQWSQLPLPHGRSGDRGQGLARNDEKSEPCWGLLLHPGDPKSEWRFSRGFFLITWCNTEVSIFGRVCRPHWRYPKTHLLFWLQWLCAQRCANHHVFWRASMQHRTHFKNLGHVHCQ